MKIAFATLLFTSWAVTAGSMVLPAQESEPDTAARPRQERRPVRRSRPRIDDAPKPGDQAPVFTLESWDGTSETSIESFRGKKPVVLFFGSYT